MCPRTASQSPSARCVVYDHAGAPLRVEDFARFHLCDLRTRPFTFDPQFEPGLAAFEPPEKPFRIALPMKVPGFGQVFVYADSRGRGYTPQSFSAGPLALNYEFAADRLATVQGLLDRCRQAGVVLSPAALERAEKAKALLKRAEALPAEGIARVPQSMASLAESLWAGEMIVTERAEQMISRNGPRPGVLFGCNASGYRRGDPTFAERFEALFNFATVASFYRRPVEPERGKSDFSRAEAVLAAIERTKMVAKGHPLIFLVPNATPDWQKGLSFEETKRSCLEHIRDSILRFRHRICIWDVINEAHVQPDNDPSYTGKAFPGFTREQNIELTAEALKVAREADPTCFRIVNSTGTWSDYYMGRMPEPWQQSVHDYVQALEDAGIEYDAVGLQYYHSGRDMVEFERNLESFSGFGRPIHISELGFPSSSEAADDHPWWGGGVGGARIRWRGEDFTEETQAQWFETFYKIAFSKPYVDALTCWDFVDPGFIPNGGLLRRDLTPKPSYERLLALLQQWRDEGLLAAAPSPGKE